MTRMFVKPKPGLKVREPNPPYAHIPEEGKEVPADSYWMRRVRDGDVIQVEPPVTPAGEEG